MAGHNRWFNNAERLQQDRARARYPLPAWPGLTPGPSGGTLIRNSGHTAGLYTRSRGHGADDMLLTGAGLWIASDNFGGGTSCGGGRVSRESASCRTRPSAVPGLGQAGLRAPPGPVFRHP